MASRRQVQCGHMGPAPSFFLSPRATVAEANQGPWTLTTDGQQLDSYEGREIQWVSPWMFYPCQKSSDFVSISLPSTRSGCRVTVRRIRHRCSPWKKTAVWRKEHEEKTSGTLVSVGDFPAQANTQATNSKDNGAGATFEDSKASCRNNDGRDVFKNTNTNTSEFHI